jgi:predicted phage terminase large subunit-like protein
MDSRTIPDTDDDLLDRIRATEVEAAQKKPVLFGRSLLTDEELRETEEMSKTFRRFVEPAFAVLEPYEFRPGWHIDAICDCLQAVEMGHIRFLLITMPYRHMKSILTSIDYPAWAWQRNPGRRFMFGSYAKELSMEHAEKSRDLIQSDWYQARWGHLYQLRDDANKKERYLTTKGGARFSTSVNSAATGFGGDVVVVDDPHNVRDRESDLVRNATVDWYLKAMFPRMNTPKTGVRIVVQQRVHRLDVAGAIIEKGGYHHLDLPAEFIAKERCVLYLKGESLPFWEDPREHDGDLLWPEHFGPVEIQEAKDNLGPFDYSAQCQQRPLAPEGAMFVRTQFVKISRESIAWQNYDWVRFWDLAASEPEPGKNPDWSVGALIGRHKLTGAKVCADIARFQLPPGKLEDEMRLVAASDGTLVPIRYEEEGGASGKIVTRVFKEETFKGYDFAGIGSVKNKTERARPMSNQAHRGWWSIVDSIFTEGALRELEQFPQGDHDDIVDAMAGGANYLDKAKTRGFKNTWDPKIHLVPTPLLLKKIGLGIDGDELIPPMRWNIVCGQWVDEIGNRDSVTIYGTVPPEGHFLHRSFVVFKLLRMPAATPPARMVSRTIHYEKAFASKEHRTILRLLPPSAVKLQEAYSYGHKQEYALWDKDVRAGLAPLRDQLLIDPAEAHPFYPDTVGRPKLYFAVPPNQMELPYDDLGFVGLRQALANYFLSEEKNPSDLEYPELQALLGIASAWFVHANVKTPRELIFDRLPEYLRPGAPVPEGEENAYAWTRHLLLLEIENEHKHDGATYTGVRTRKTLLR